MGGRNREAEKEREKKMERREKEEGREGAREREGEREICRLGAVDHPPHSDGKLLV